MGSKRDMSGESVGAGSRVGACLGIALLLAGTGCGTKDEAGGTSVAALAAVNPADDSAFGGWLAANEIERYAVEPEQGTRGVSASASGLWALYPRGETRAEALGSYALEVSPAGFVKGGVIELRRGKTVLHREPKPFAPITRFVYGRFPSPVTEAIKSGENLTWGVYYADQPELDVVATLRVVFKPAAERQLARVSSDPRNAEQTALVKSLGRGQVLLNNSLFGEALRGYLAVAQEDPLVAESWARIGDCMRRMNLKSAPLYGDALARASSSSKSNARNRTNPGGGLDGADAATATPAGQPQAGQPASGRPTSPAPMPPAAGAAAAARKALGALGDMASARTSTAQSTSTDAQRGLEAAQQALAAATAALAAADEAGRNRAQATAEEAARRAAEAQAAADKAAAQAEQARADERLMAEWTRIMGSAPATPQERAETLRAISAWAGGLQQQADAARTRAEELARQATAATESGDPQASELMAQAQAAAQDAAQGAQAADAARAQIEQLRQARRDTGGR